MLRNKELELDDTIAEGITSITKVSVLEKIFANISSERRKAIVDTKVNNCTVLFKACLNDNLELVKYLLVECNADTEITGIHTVPQHNFSQHEVPPLWSAAITNKLEIVKLLTEHGAKVDGCSDSGSTAVRAACFNNHLEMVKYLVENGADVNIPNKFGATCLMNAIESLELSEYLIGKGADVKAVETDRNMLTALHYAANYDNLETVKLFLKHGADINAKTSDGLTPMMLTALYNNTETFKFFLEDGVDIPLSDKIDAMEILGAKLVDCDDELLEGISWWQAALKKRDKENVPKVLPPPLEFFCNAKEPETLEELESMLRVEENILLYSMMVYHRVLSPVCEHTIFHCMQYARMLKMLQKYQLSLNVYIHAYNACMERKSVLSGNCIRCVYRIITILKDAKVRNMTDRNEKVLQLFENQISHISAANSYLSSEDISETDEKQYYYQLLLMTLDTIIIALHIIGNGEDFHFKATVFKNLDKLIKMDPKGLDDQSLIHMTVNLFHPMRQFTRHPSPAEQMLLFKALLDCGANINSVDQFGNSPLFYLVEEFDEDEDENMLKEMLIRRAHLDMCNKNGNTPLKIIRQKGLAVCELKHRTLQCIAASTLCQHGIPYRSEISAHLSEFVKVHGKH